MRVIWTISEKKWAGVPDEEIEEESDEEYYATLRPHIVGIVSEYAHILKALFNGTVYEKISYEDIVLRICERLARGYRQLSVRLSLT